jgi:hypothetical protein
MTKLQSSLDKSWEQRQRPAEFAALQPIGKQAQACAVPEDQLHSVGARETDRPSIAPAPAPQARQHSPPHALTTPAGRPKTASLHRSQLLPTAENSNQNDPVLQSQTTVVTPWEYERQVRLEPRDFLQSMTCEEMDMKAS